MKEYQGKKIFEILLGLKCLSSDAQLQVKFGKAELHYAQALGRPS